MSTHPQASVPESILAERCMHMWEDPETESEVEVIQTCLTFCDPMDCILQARILEWVAYLFSSRSSEPRNRTEVYTDSEIAR